MPELTDEMVASMRTEQAQVEVYDQSFRGGGSFGVRVGRGGRRAFFLIYSVGARRKRITLGLYPTMRLDDARAKALELLRDVAEGKDPAAERRSKSLAPTFSVLWQLFYDGYVRSNCKARTSAEYKRIAERDFFPRWADRKISSIDSSEVGAFLTEVAEVRGRSVMALRSRSLLFQLFAFAVKRGLTTSNPVSEIPPLPQIAPAERVLSLSELKGVWAALAGLRPEISAIFKMLILTGQRPGEVVKLKWQDILLDTWLVRTSMGRRQIYLTPKALEALKAVRQPDSEFVFPGKRSPHITFIRRAAKALSAEAGINPPFAPLDIRRSVAHHLRALGVRPDIVEHLQNRRFTEARQGGYDYTSDIRDALVKWESVIAVSPAKPPGDKLPADRKVIDLASHRRKLLTLHRPKREED